MHQLRPTRKREHLPKSRYLPLKCLKVRGPGRSLRIIFICNFEFFKQFLISQRFPKECSSMLELSFSLLMVGYKSSPSTGPQSEWINSLSMRMVCLDHYYTCPTSFYQLSLALHPLFLPVVIVTLLHLTFPLLSQVHSQQMTSEHSISPPG